MPVGLKIGRKVEFNFKLPLVRTKLISKRDLNVLTNLTVQALTTESVQE